MTLAWLGPLIAFALVTCGTPGPNNMLLTAAGANLGFRKGLPLLFSVVTGLNLIILATALGLGVLITSRPALASGLKTAGSLYLLWLALKLARAGMPGERSVSEMPRWHQAALAQLLNPKGWFMALSAVSGFARPSPLYWTSALSILGVFWAAGILTGAFWLLFGASVRRFLKTPAAWRTFNLTMGVLTAGCIAMVWV
jgi:threonine/homoserine/homoserine lactone efflux protein